MNRASTIARALVVLMLATVLIGTGRTVRYALQHDPHGGNPVALWTWLIAPLSGGIVSVLVTEIRGLRGVLRRAALFAVGAASWVLFAFLTYVVVLNNVGCVSVNGSSDDCGLGLAIGMALGSILLFTVMVSTGVVLFALSWLLRPGGSVSDGSGGGVWGKLDWADDGNDVGQRPSRGDRPRSER